MIRLNKTAAAIDGSQKGHLTKMEKKRERGPREDTDRPMATEHGRQWPNGKESRSE